MSNICKKTSNNKYFNCPPRMDDGRHFTDYRPNNHVNNLIRNRNNSVASFEYRQFLIHNASRIMEINNEYNLQINGCSPCNANPIFVENLCKVNNSVSKCESYDCNGLGQRSIAVASQPLPYNPGFQGNQMEKAFKPEPVKQMNYVDYAAIPGKMARVLDNKLGFPRNC